MTDPVAIIAGISAGRYRRAMKPPPYKGWIVKVLPSSNHKHDDLASIWKRAANEADRAGEAGAHLLLTHHRGSELPRFNEQIRDRCYRAIWLSPEISKQYGTESFWEKLNILLQFEDSWRNEIRPTVGSPLMLPEISFSASSSVRDMWRRVGSVNRSHDEIEHVQRVIERFHQSHRRTEGWHDTKGLVFGRGPAHGSHGLDSWRRSKFTCYLPEGFHFDVRHYRSRSFNVACRDGNRSFGTYTNIDPHGFIRGGH